ncbi:MAG: exodeoxyribonuclease VII large subunit [Bacteroidales bacterium]|nr:exodeoxyribonuclease VII large subunit [Bacteroidales bacterium]
MKGAERALTLLEFNSRIGRALAAAPELIEEWVTAETSDVRVSGGHCYMELIDKDAATGVVRARARATIWASRYVRLSATFIDATGSRLASGIKVMVRVSANFHPVYGLSLNITDIDPSYTLGDLLRRRREILARLESEGVVDRNRSLVWPDVPSRVAVVSAAGAAGYGDFINQLYTNRYHLRFSTTLFEAVMQGERTVPSVMQALGEIYAEHDAYDCVVIIRGGGATGDLASFDDYELARLVAMFPLPIIVGIGHERDVTVLDYVANMRVKTPTAAAEWLIGRGADALAELRDTGAEIMRLVNSRLQQSHRRLDSIAGELPPLTRGIIARMRMRVGDEAAERITQLACDCLRRQSDRLRSLAELIDTLSPEATLRRGFSITRVDGRAVTDSASVPAGAVITTTLASGQIRSTKV